MKQIRFGRLALGTLALALVASAFTPAVAKSTNHDVQRIALRCADGVQHDRAPGPLEGLRQRTPDLDQG